MKRLINILQNIKAFFIRFVMRSFWNELIEAHKFFVKESKSYVGKKKQDRTKSFPTFGYITNYNTKPFNPKNKKWGINGVAYQEYWAYSFKDFLYYPIAYIKFMWLTLNYA